MKQYQIRLLLLLLLSGIFAWSASAQSHQVSGTVTDAETGESIPGVNIVVQGTTDQGTTTNFDGEYSLSVPSPETTLIFSYIGYQRLEVNVNGRDEINVEMITDVTGLDELVVIGYGVRERGDNTGSVDVISSRDFNQGAITSPQDLLSGRAAGVNVTSNSGAPGAGSTIRIRGGSSLSASNDPLFVVDGIPLDDGGISGMRNPLNTINPDDIESMTILKDASATAIYGSRASNGVVIITTKRGSAGQALQVNYSGKYSYQTNNDRIDVLSVEDFEQVVGVIHGDRGRELLGDSRTDWQDEIFRNAFSQDHNINATGSIGDLPFRASVGFSGNEGVLRTSSNDRLTGSLAVNPAFLDDHLRLDVNVRGMQVSNRFAETGAIGSAITFDPTQPVESGNEEFGGFFAWTDTDGNPIPISPANPVSLIDQRMDESTVYRGIANLKLDYDLHFLPELTATLNMGLDYSDVGDGNVRITDEAAFMGGGTARGELTEYTQRKENEVLDFYLNYETELPELRSALDITAGYSWEHHFEEGSTYSTNFNRDETLQVNADTEYATEHYLVSFFGRANYTFDEKYLFTATLRQDGTSRFSPDERWGLFPSFAFAWQMHREPFLENVDTINELKLRLGYGVTGQQRIGQGDYPYLARYTISEETAQYQFGNEFLRTFRPDGFNANLKWEETTTYNVGLDYSLFDERLFGSLEAYYRQTDDLLNVIPVPAGSNFTNRILSNVGTLEVRGLEFNVTGRVLSTEDTYWQVGLNTTYNIDEITQLTTVDDPNFIGVPVGGIAGGTGNTAQINSVGHPRNTFYLYEQVYDENGMPIEGEYVDQNGDGSITTDDLYRSKSPTPDLTFGISSRLEHKQWDASFSARANFGNYVYNNVASDNTAFNEMYNSTGFLTNTTSSVVETFFRSPQYLSDHYLEDASFFRMDNITVGYTVNDLFNAVSSMRVSATMQNVFTITGYSGQDPEVVGGIDYNLYPRPQTFVLGVNLNF